MFEGTIQLFDEYYRAMDKSAAVGFNKDLGCEVRERLQQLDYIIKRVQHLEHTAEKSMSRSKSAFLKHVEDLKSRGVPFESAPAPQEMKVTQEEFEQHQAAFFEMKLLTETFYYLAGRVRTILKNKQAPLPNLTSFECEGVRNVRNKLLEHAEGADSQVSIQSFGWGATHGPVLKAIRYGGQEQIFPDRGLYRNAEELRGNLERVVKSALA
jgi:hypothetical protein